MSPAGVDFAVLLFSALLGIQREGGSGVTLAPPPLPLCHSRWVLQVLWPQLKEVEDKLIIRQFGWQSHEGLWQAGQEINTNTRHMFSLRLQYHIGSP